MLWSRARGVKQTCTVLPSSTITGVGGGARIDGAHYTMILPNNSTTSISGATLSDIRLHNGSNTAKLVINKCFIDDKSGRIAIDGTNGTLTVEITGSTVKSTSVSIRAKYSTITNCVMAGSAISINCTINGRVLFDGSTVSTIYTGANPNLCHMDGSTIWILKNSKIVNGTWNIIGATGHTNQKLIFDGYCTVLCHIVSNNNTTEITHLIAGCTINLTGNTWTNPIIGGNTTNGVQVGTFANADYTGTWTTGGIATIITTTGATVKVSGEGTYIDKDGTTNLDVVN